MEKLLNVDNDWDGEVDCAEVMGPCCITSEEEVATAIKGLKIGKAAGPTGEMKKKEFNGTSTHLLDGYISANQIFFLHS